MVGVLFNVRSKNIVLHLDEVISSTIITSVNSKSLR